MLFVQGEELVLLGAVHTFIVPVPSGMAPKDQRVNNIARSHLFIFILIMHSYVCMYTYLPYTYIGMYTPRHTHN